MNFGNNNFVKNTTLFVGRSTNSQPQLITRFYRILAISRHDPEITGLMPNYAFGDYIDANCTSDQSNPPSDLTWYIDERKVSEYIFIK